MPGPTTATSQLSDAVGAHLLGRCERTHPPPGCLAATEYSVPYCRLGPSQGPTASHRTYSAARIRGLGQGQLLLLSTTSGHLRQQTAIYMAAPMPSTNRLVSSPPEWWSCWAQNVQGSVSISTFFDDSRRRGDIRPPCRAAPVRRSAYYYQDIDSRDKTYCILAKLGLIGPPMLSQCSCG